MEDLQEFFEEGEKVLFNDRKTPLTVKNISGKQKMLVGGPNGGEYEIYKDEGTLLVCRKGNERYSSYCKDLRSVGEWIRDEFIWTHSVSKAEIRVEQKDNGFWKLVFTNFDADFDSPMYGFTSKEAAVEEVEKLVENHPEGLKT